LEWSLLVLVVLEERVLIRLAASTSETCTAVGVLDCSPQQTGDVVSRASHAAKLFGKFDMMSIKSVFSLMMSFDTKEAQLHSRPVLDVPYVVFLDFLPR
jgi:hypothetical protein